LAALVDLFDLMVGEITERLQNQDLEYQRPGRRPFEHGSPDDPIQHLERIADRAQR
jgi:hypothetical protein